MLWAELHTVSFYYMHENGAYEAREVIRQSNNKEREKEKERVSLE